MRQIASGKLLFRGYCSKCFAKMPPKIFITKNQLITNNRAVTDIPYPNDMPSYWADTNMNALILCTPCRRKLEIFIFQFLDDFDLALIDEVRDLLLGLLFGMEFHKAGEWGICALDLDD